MPYIYGTGVILECVTASSVSSPCQTCANLERTVAALMQGCERKAAITTFPCPCHIRFCFAAFEDGLNGNAVPIIANCPPPLLPVTVTSEICDRRRLD
jgi:hypothetical protein